MIDGIILYEVVYILQLKKLRKERKISQAKFAQAIGVSRSAVSMWEIEASQPDNDMLITIAKYFNISVDELLGNTVDVQVENNEPSEADKLYEAYINADDNVKEAINKLLGLG